MESLPYARSKAGWKKIEMTCEASHQANILHTWIDTCCIDKRSSAELSEAINSMFAWYQQSSLCYVYLSDLVFPCSPVDTEMPRSDEGRQWADAAFSNLENELRACRWFTRGWTLQELIAPSQIVFLDQNWNLIGSRAPESDLRFIKILERLTAIPSSVLEYKTDIATIPVAQRMSWAARRETTRVEDIAYCLLGIFDVNMPLLYGEGSKSFVRLQEEIVKSHDDLSLFAWKQNPASYGIGVLRGCFANSPAEFAHWLNIEIRTNNFESGMEVTSKNVHMEGRVLRQEEYPRGIRHGVDHIFDLGVQHPDNKECSLGILLTSSSRSLTYFRFKPYELIKVPLIKDLFDAEDTYYGFESDDSCWEEREEAERRSVSIRKYISIRETREIGHHQKPVFKINWHEDVLKVLKSVNGQNTKEYIPSFECRQDSASHEDGTLTWVTDFELQIDSQYIVSLVLVTGLQWGPCHARYPACFERAKMPGQEFWAVLLGEGRSYVISDKEKSDGQPPTIELRGETSEDNSSLVWQIKRMDHRGVQLKLGHGSLIRHRIVRLKDADNININISRFYDSAISLLDLIAPAGLLDYACNLATMSSNMFQYKPLAHRDSFRLFHLDPSPNHSADLKGSLHHAILSDCDYDLIEPYAALSYVWGDVSQNGAILLGDNAKEITASLDAALRDLRDKSRVCRIWVDALCIDQSNNVEKGVQVALMRRIYSTAHHTVIHLGKSPPGFGILFMNLRAQSQTTMHGNASGLEQLSLTADEIDGMRCDLLSKPWFRRVWVFQELVLSTDVWVQCDDLRIRWHHFCEAVDTKSVVAAMLLDTLSDGITQQSQPRNATPLENMNSRRYGAFEAPLSTLLSCRRGIGATDPRDIVFGHLGVVSDPDRCNRFITVDYDRDLARVSVKYSENLSLGIHVLVHKITLYYQSRLGGFICLDMNLTICLYERRHFSCTRNPSSLVDCWPLVACVCRTPGLNLPQLSPLFDASIMLFRDELPS
ncbi:beta transducin [Fusarium coicis]|nr:beta transducin [Fusarium coicis]